MAKALAKAKATTTAKATATAEVTATATAEATTTTKQWRQRRRNAGGSSTVLLTESVSGFAQNEGVFFSVIFSWFWFGVEQSGAVSATILELEKTVCFGVEA
ncbi:hypothetical protein [Tunturiibacter gelidoferens]|uniref:Uncharacterized protein n=1 Tax=Tunturiibacter lichenicola TaxID=2051959 RepID=A0A7Y9NLX7_9BACT|nr:hypothetical protein [Edaphobacter lichenicola]NYF51682.1 hypothetical protein [Edaphobacter lichenicola]